MGGDRVAHLGETAILFERHVGTVSVRAVVRPRYDARKAPLADTVRHLGLQGVPRSVTDIQICPDPLLLLSPGNDVDHAAHGVRTVQHRSRTSQHLYPFGQHRLIGVSYRMAEDTHILGLPVDQDEQLRRRTAAQTAQAHTAGSPRRDAVTHHPARGDEESRDLLREQWKQRTLLPAFDRGTVNNRYRHRQVTNVRGITRARHHNRVDRYVI